MNKYKLRAMSRKKKFEEKRLFFKNAFTSSTYSNIEFKLDEKQILKAIKELEWNMRQKEMEFAWRSSFGIKTFNTKDILINSGITS